MDMTDIKEISLREALSSSGCHELPSRYVDGDGSGFWFKAIGLVRKRNGSVNYVLLERRGDGAMRVVRDFGMMSPVYGIVSVHPYMFIDERFMLDVNSPSFVHAAAVYLGVGDDVVSGYGEERLLGVARSMAISRQLDASSRVVDIVDDMDEPIPAPVGDVSANVDGVPSSLRVLSSSSGDRKSRSRSSRVKK